MKNTLRNGVIMFQSIENNFVTDLQCVPASYTMKHFHEHEYHEMIFICHSSCTLQVKSKQDKKTKRLYMLTSGSVAIIPAGAPHKTTYLPGMEHERGILYFDNSELQWVDQELGKETVEELISGMFLQIPSRKIASFRDNLERICYEHKGVDRMSLSFMRSYFHTLILFMLRCYTYKENVIAKMDVANQQIQNVIEYLMEHFMEDITLSNTADYFHMSESSLSKKFKSFTGQRFREYLIHIRTRAAADALINTTLSMTDIAIMCGFSDSNTFGDTFRRIYHTSPTEYRRHN